MKNLGSNSNSRLMKVLGEIVKKHRNAKKRTIYLISAEASMSKSTWRDVELGLSKDIKLTTLWKIAEGLDISIGDLLNEVSEKLGNFTINETD